MKSVRHNLTFALVGIALTSCVTPFRAPADVANVKLERVDSSTLTVEKIWLERESGQLFLRGFVLKRMGATPEPGTHLDVTLFDAGGTLLRSSIVQYTPPRFISHFQSHNRNHASYKVLLDPLPAGTARVEARVHEGEHPTHS